MSDDLELRRRLQDIAREVSATRGMVAAGYEAFIAEDQQGYHFRRTGERVVEIIHEAAAKLPGHYKNQRPEVPWSVLRGMRNRITHAYGDVDYDILWDTLATDLPAVAEALKLELPEHPYKR